MSDDLDAFRERMRGSLADLFGMEILEVERGRSVGRLDLRPDHRGRTTQVWDARVTRESDARPIALFRCTQYVLR